MGTTSDKKKEMFGYSEEESTLIKKEVVKTTKKYKNEFEKWLGSKRQKAMLQMIADNCARKKEDEEIELMASPVITGITYQFNKERWDEEEFLFLFDYLTEALKSKGFEPQPAEIENWKHSDCLETIQRQHLIGKDTTSLDKILLGVYYYDGKLTSLKCAGCTFQQPSISSVCFHQLLVEIAENDL